MAERRLERMLRPRVVFPLLAVLLVLAIIFSPAGDETAQVRTMTTFATSPFGAKAIYEVLGLLGWRVQRRQKPFDQTLDTASTYVILDPPNDPSATEVSALLDAVRRGATIIVVPSAGSALADSLGIQRSDYQFYHPDIAPPAEHDSVTAATRALRAAAEVRHEFAYYLEPVPKSEDDTAPVFPADAVTMLRILTDSSVARPAVMERPMGRGRAVVSSDVNFFRNSQVRDTTAAVLAVHLIELASPDSTRPLVFDEYHQGYGEFTGMTGVLVRALTTTAAGRVALQVLIAGLILLAAFGIRPIAPRARSVIERRSPFEHVGALSRAYEQVKATKLATRRLVRGLRRRHPLGSAAAPDAQYLAVLAERAPGAADDVSLLQRALDVPLPATEWVTVGGAIDHIERILSP